jgi:integrase
VGKWKARFRAVVTGGAYRETTLGKADDNRDADGDRILNFTQAQEKARAWFAAVAGVKSTGPYTVGDALDDYLKEFEGKSLYQTQKRVEVLIRPALGSIELAKLTSEAIKGWHRGRASAPSMLRTAKQATMRNVRQADTPEAVNRHRSTANRDLTVLRAALNKAFQNKKVGSDAPWRAVKPFSNVEGVRLRVLTDDESRRLVNACQPGFRCLVQCALFTGARYGDLCKTRVRDFDPHSQTLFVPLPKGERRHVWLTEEGAEFVRALTAGRRPDDLLLHREDGEEWKQSQQARPIEDAAKLAKLDKVTFHDLRHTYGARLARNKVPMAIIAKAMGHKDERVTRRHYAHMEDSFLAEAIRTGGAGFGINEASNVTAIGNAPKAKRISRTAK